MRIIDEMYIHEYQTVQGPRQGIDTKAHTLETLE